MIKRLLSEALTFELIEQLMDEEYPSTWDIDIFKSLNNFNERIKYCEENLIRISSGSARVVYKIDNEKVLKLAKNKKGLAQNQVEIDYSNDYLLKYIVAHTFDSDENALWVEMELARKCTPNIFKNIVGFSFKDFVHMIRYYEGEIKYGRNMWSKPDNFDMMYENDFIREILDYISNYDNPTGDLMRLSTYGVVKRSGEDAIVMIDYGLSRDVHTTYYK